MDLKELVRRNLAVYDSGISSNILENPYNLNNGQLRELEATLQSLSKQYGEEMVLVEWGQPFGGPVLDRRYHSKEKIRTLTGFYSLTKAKGLCPRPGLVVDKLWVAERKPTKGNNNSFGEYLKKVDQMVF